MRAEDRPEAAATLPALLIRNRNFLLLWAAYGISAVGDHLSEMALIKELGGLERPDVTRVQALITFAFFAPFPLMAAVAGWWADRFNRKWIMIGADLIRAAIVINFAVALSLLLARGLGDYAVVLPVAATGALAAFFSPARKALLPALIRQEQLVRANAMIAALGTIGTIVSAVLGGWLVELAERGHMPLVWNYRIDALTFLLSAALLAAIDLRRTRRVTHPRPRGLWRPLSEGFRYVATHRRVAGLIGLSTVFWAAAGVVISVVPALVRDVFGGGFQDAGLYRGLIGVGLACGAAVMSAVGPAMPLQLRVLSGVAGGAFWMLALAAACAWRLGPLAVGLCLLGIGGAGAAIQVTVNAALQRFVPDSRRGRVFGVSDMCTTSAIAATSGLLGLPHIPALDRLTPLLLALTGLGLLLALVVAWRAYHRPHREYPGLIVLLSWIAQSYARLTGRLRRIGPCTLPRRGAVIVASNHTCGFDPILIQACCPYRLISYLVAREYYERPLAGWFMRRIRCVPIDRQRPSKSFLSRSLRLLRDGGCLCIFPQGTFEVPGEPPPPPRPGVGLLALRTGVPVIPCCITGTRYFDDPLRSYLALHRARVRFGRPVDLSDLIARARDPDAPQQAAERIMRAIDALRDEPPTSGAGSETSK